MHIKTLFKKNKRLQPLMIGICVLCCIIVARLIQLQGFEHQHYATLSRQNQISVIPIPPPRGIILDRNGVVLADNMPYYVLTLTPEHVQDIPQTLQQLQALLPRITTEDLDLFYRLKKQNRPHIPIPITVNLSEEEIATFAVNQYRFPGIRMQIQSLRYYPFGEETAHLLGYVGRINPEELQTLSKNYRGTTFIGKTGIERYYETLLHGKNGYEQIETDVHGRIVHSIQKVSSQPGVSIQLTIDARLQHIAYRALDNHQGAIVLMHPQTGDILAFVSRPGFNPNHFVTGINQTEYQHLIHDTSRPLFNRAARGLYPPASTIKPYIALTGLHVGVINENTAIYDPGWYQLPHVQHRYHDWYKPGHGMVNVTRAITVSCDPYFYHLGHLLGIDVMHHMLSQFGFGQLTHIDLLEEVAGVLPSTAWKKRHHGTPWYPGDNLISAIGQGFMLASPLQMTVAVSTLAQQGRRMRPHLLQSIQTAQNKIKFYKPVVAHTIHLHHDQYWQIIHHAMHTVTTSPEGTGYRFGLNPPYTVAAKTGTAQVFSGSYYQKRKNEPLPHHLKDHSLFIAFAPLQQPQIAIAVIVEHDNLAASVARKILDLYFQEQTS